MVGKLLRRTRRSWNRWSARFGSQFVCPVCGKSSGRFLPYGDPLREHARCPHCRALERHRLAWLYFQRETDLFDGREKRVLHVAPERCLEPLLRERLGDGYVTADLMNPKVDRKMDITDIDEEDATYDVIYCSHVLEHVPDDRAAMREFRRVLKPGGWAVLLVPVMRDDHTDEDPSVTDPEERRRRFGQFDHVRAYGPDYADRLAEAGFMVQQDLPADFLTAEDIERYAITPGAGDIYRVR